MPSHADMLEQKLSVLQLLNPDEAALVQEELLTLSADVGPAQFPRFAAFAAELVERYSVSPIKQAQQRLFTDYFRSLEQATRFLAAKGDLDEAAPLAAAGEPAGASIALVPRGRYSPRDWFNLMTRAEIPADLLHAVTAAQQRNRYVPSVLETMFLVLQRIDSRQAFAWEQEFLRHRSGNLDADIVRDLLRAWLQTDALPPPLLEAALQWDGDENLYRQWPAVTATADELLRQQLLRRWLVQKDEDRDDQGTRRRILAVGTTEPTVLTRWAAGCVADIGESAQFFVSISEQMRDADATPPDWQTAALFAELKTLSSLFEPVVLLADLVTRDPGGTARFAMALFGLGKTGTDLWRSRVQDQAEKIIRRVFLQGLRNGTAPETSIRQLCFGDADLFAQLQRKLDLGTRQFDSLSQRDLVVKRLASHYLSRREYQLTAQEIGRRFRCLLRVLHEDSLRRLLTGKQFATLGSLHGLNDIIGLLTAARRYLDRRRDLDQDLSDIVAAEDAFAADVRLRRLRRLRRLLLAPR